MKKPESSINFYSVFYSQDKWHVLLQVLRELLIDRDLIQAKERYVFLSAHQGCSIRIALRSDKGRSATDHEAFVDATSSYIKQNPSTDRGMQVPIKSFFTDFPNNVIKYNLYNERSIIPGGLLQFQLVLSKILLTFFDDHEVDEDGLFTLIVTLNEAILNGLCEDEQAKANLLRLLQSKLDEEIDEYPFPMIEGNFFSAIQYLATDFDIDDLLQWIEQASYLLSFEAPNTIDVYLTIIHIVKLHLLKLDNEFFIDALCHLENSFQSQEIYS